MVGECDDLVRTVAPHLDAVQVERVWSAGGVVRVAARTRELAVVCPDCGLGSTRVHSRYWRVLADVAIGGRPVLVRLSVRRLFCDAPGCGRRTFAEQVEGLTVRDDAPAPIKQAATDALRGKVTAESARGRRVLIVPVVLSYGGIEAGIRERLAGLPFDMAGNALLPDARLVDWVLAQARAVDGRFIDNGQLTKGNLKHIGN